MNVNSFKVKIKNKQEIAENTLAVNLEKMSCFKFKAGQFVKMSLINPPFTDEKGNTRNFSIASAPHESDILVVTRIGDSAFKKVLKDLEPGTKIEINGPYGSFTLHDDPTYYAVFLVGGIGIAPVRSIVYIIGPPVMVSAMRQLLEQMKVNESQIKTEVFVGY